MNSPRQCSGNNGFPFHMLPSLLCFFLVRTEIPQYQLYPERHFRRLPSTSLFQVKNGALPPVDSHPEREQPPDRGDQNRENACKKRGRTALIADTARLRLVSGLFPGCPRDRFAIPLPGASPVRVCRDAFCETLRLKSNNSRPGPHSRTGDAGRPGRSSGASFPRRCSRSCCSATSPRCPY